LLPVLVTVCFVRNRSGSQGTVSTVHVQAHDFSSTYVLLKSLPVLTLALMPISSLLDHWSTSSYQHIPVSQ